MPLAISFGEVPQQRRGYFCVLRRLKIPERVLKNREPNTGLLSFIWMLTLTSHSTHTHTHTRSQPALWTRLSWLINRRIGRASKFRLGKRHIRCVRFCHSFFSNFNEIELNIRSKWNATRLASANVPRRIVDVNHLPQRTYRSEMASINKVTKYMLSLIDDHWSAGQRACLPSNWNAPNCLP